MGTAQQWSAKLMASAAGAHAEPSDDDLIKAVLPLKQTDASAATWRTQIIEQLNMGDYTHQTECAVDVDEPIFQPTPAVVQFCEYEALRTYTASLAFRNNDKFARRIKVVPPASPYFAVTANTAPKKLARGMEAAFTITFTPDSEADFSWDLVVCTEREKFIVPIRARGARGRLTLPKEVAFGDACACKIAAQRSFLMRNTGRRATSFELAADAPFAVAPRAGSLAVGESLQCTFTFTPQRVGAAHGELRVMYETGDAASVPLYGGGADTDVQVAPSAVRFVKTFVTKASQKAFRVTNNTAAPVRFALKQYATEAEEEGVARRQADALLVEAEAAESSTAHADDSTDAAEAAAARERLFKRLLTQTCAQKHLFESAVVHASPLEGLIYPGSFAEVTLQFCPDFAREFTERVYVDVDGLSMRPPVAISGLGLGPKAIFSYDVLDVGSVYIHTAHHYEVQLENRGEVPVPFSALPASGPLAHAFTLEPSRGVVAVDESLRIGVRLLADTLGKFDERMALRVEGTDEPLQVQFKGRVVGPTCEASAAELDYGMVAYGFRYTKDIDVRNTSKIPMRFAWRVDNGARGPEEFNVIPEQGSILAGAQQTVRVEFIAKHVCAYTAEVVMDIPGVQERALVLPVVAECVVPRLSIPHETLDFGDCFLEFPAVQTLRLANDAKLPAKFQVEPQGAAGAALAQFTCEPSEGAISAQGDVELRFTLKTARLGRIQLPCRIHAVGSSLPPIEVVIAARSVGPILRFGSSDAPADTAAVAFGRVAVLETHTSTLRVFNDSSIEASIKSFIAGKDSSFSVSVREALLAPSEGLDINVTVQLDETYAFEDTLHFLVENGAELCVPLSATGTGHTLFCQDLTYKSELAFGDQFTGQAFSRTVTVQNQGRRAANVAWVNAEFERIKKELGKSIIGPNREIDPERIPLEKRLAFSVEPVAVAIAAKQSHDFVITGFSLAPGQRSEQLQLLGGTGKSAKAERVIFDFAAVADVAVPLLSFSSRSLMFEYFYHPINQQPPRRQQLVVSNASRLPLHTMLHVARPFELSVSELQLAPGQEAALTVTMRHDYKKDLVSHKPKRKLEVTFEGNPQRDSIDLLGSINYPNASLSRAEIDFGSVLNDTHKVVEAAITNTSEVPVKYRWEIAADAVQQARCGAGNIAVGINELFDVKPIEGFLQPGEAEPVRVTYFAFAGQSASANATMHVHGGPSIVLPLRAEPNSMSCSLEPRDVIFGVTPYDTFAQKQVVLSNPSRVAFDWKFNSTTIAADGLLTSSPSSGHVAAGSKQTVTLKVRPGIPERIKADAFFEIAHFDPVRVHITVEGVYASLATSLPRIPEPEWPSTVQRALEKIQDNGSRLLEAALRKDRKARRDGKSALHSGTSSPPATASNSKPKVLLHALDGSALFGKVKAFRDPETGKSTELALLEVEAEADRLHLCDVLSEPACHTSTTQAPRGSDGAKAAGSAESAAAPAAGEHAGTKRVQASDAALAEASSVAAPAAAAEQAADGARGAAVPQPAATQQPLPSGAQKRRTRGGASSLGARAGKASAGPAPSSGRTRPMPAARAPPASTPPAAQHGDSKQGRKKGVPKALSKEVVLRRYGHVFSRFAHPPPLFSGHYLCDLGTIVKGLSASKKFCIQNTSTQAAHLSIDKSVLEAYGCALTPEKLPNLSGAPEFGAAELTLTMQTGAQHVFPGHKEFHLPIDIRGAPPALVTVRAAVVVPEVACSAAEVDFGAVQWSMARVHTLRLSNRKAVAAEWAFRRPVEDAQCVNWDFYRCEPDSGVLPPHASIDVRIFFTPDTPGKHPDAYPQELPLRVTHNHRAVAVMVTGTCYAARARVAPKAIDLGAMLPTSLGGDAEPVSRDIELRNPGPGPVEVVALDFDSQHLEEEAVLAAWHGYRADLGYALLPPRAPGTPFWPEVRSAVEAAQAAASGSKTPSARRGEDTAELLPAVDGDVSAPEAMPADEVADASLAEEPALGEGTAVEPEPQGFYAVVACFDDGIGAEQAARLAERYGVPVTTLTDLVLDAGELVEEAAGEAFDPEKGTTFGDYLYEELIGWEAEGGATRRPYLEKPVADVEALVGRAITAALRQPRFARGFVLRGLACEFAPTGAALQAVLASLGLERGEVAAGAAEGDAPVWRSPDKQVWFVTLDMTIEEADARRKAALSPEDMRLEAEAAAAAAVEAAAAAAVPAKGKKTPPKKATGKDKKAADAPPAPVVPEGIHAALGARFFEHDAALQAAHAVALPPHADNVVRRRGVHVGAAAPPPAVLHDRVTGIAFERDALRRVLPPAATDADLVPPQYDLQVVRRPAPRKARPPVPSLKLFAVLPAPLPPPKPQTPPDAPKGKPAKGKAAVPAPEPEPEPKEILEERARWVLQPGESAPARLQFCSEEVVQLDAALAFEVSGSDTKTALAVTAACAYPQLCTDPKTVYKRRVTARPGREGEVAIRKQYVLNRERFEFGPLLVGRARPEGAAGAAPHVHAAPLHLVNSGCFPLRARLVLKSARAAEQDADVSKAPTKAKGKGKEAPAPVAPATPFAVDTAEVELGVGEAADVVVWCFPQELGPVADALVCVIENNPEPVEFPLAALGTAPTVDVRLEGDAAAAAAAAPPAAEPPVVGTKTRAGKAAEPPPPARPPNRVLDEGIVFARLLPGRTDGRAFVVTNTSQLPVSWALQGAEALPGVFKLSHKDDKGKLSPLKVASGTLGAYASTTVHVEFCSAPLEGEDAQRRAKQFEHALRLEVSDADKALGAVQTETIVVHAETYVVDAQLHFAGDPADRLDFGLLRVQDSASRTFSVHNAGKYPITIDCAVTKQRLNGLLALEPSFGEIAAGASQSITATFNAKHALKRELRLDKEEALHITVTEPATAQAEGSLIVPVSLEAVLSKYSLSPHHGLDFGPQVYNTSSAPRRLELKNTGRFPFSFRLFDRNNPAAEDPPSSKEASRKDVKKGKGAPAAQGVLVGAFAVSPAFGQVESGCAASIEVVFNASGQQALEETLGIDVEHRLGTDHPGGVPFTLRGESCVPGIECAKVQSIFEEHNVVKELDPSAPVRNTYGINDKAFSFGTVVADLVTGGGGGTPSSANLRVTNVSKVACEVDLTVRSVDKTSALEPCAFAVQPAQLSMPALEHRYVRVSFHPKQINSFVVALEALVRNGQGCPSTHRFACELRGRGVIPTLSVADPSALATDGSVALDFDRVMPNQCSTRKLVVCNSGHMPAVASLEVDAASAFAIAEGLASATVQPGATHAFTLRFGPTAAGQSSAVARLAVAQNPFEATAIKLRGECFQADVTFAGLPSNEADTVRLPDCALGQQQTQAFSLQNHSEKHFRVTWPSHPQLRMTPEAVHLHARASAECTLTFSSSTAVALNAAQLVAALTEFQCPGGELVPWSSDSKGDAEPPVDVVKGSEKKLPLTVFARSDTVRFECSTNSVTFKTTPMFQARTFAFPLKNTGTVSLAFESEVQGLDGAVEECGLYSVTPAAAEVAPGQQAQIAVRFAPTEVQDCARRLMLRVKGLAEGVESPSIELNGRAQRPWCHFEVRGCALVQLPASDYATSSRRPAAAQVDHAPLDPETLVIEIESLGVGARNVRRFLVRNPTNVAYAFMWEAAPGGTGDAPSPLRCLVPKGNIAGGARCEMAFEFAPRHDRTVEAPWTFCIPSQGIRVPFVVAGHVVEPNVSFAAPCINFDKVLVGKRAKLTVDLINREPAPFHFAFDKASFEATAEMAKGRGKPAPLTFEPPSGVVPANGSVTVAATFRPNSEAPVNYSVLCNVKQKPSKLTLNVKGQGYAVCESVLLESADGEEVPLSAKAANRLDLGQVLVNEKCIRSLAVVNRGLIPVDFDWTADSDTHVTLSPASGSVGVGERQAVQLCYVAHARHKLAGKAIRCQIASGRTYAIELAGFSRKPKLHVSFTSHDFGKVYEHADGAAPLQKELLFRNDDHQDISFAIEHEDTDVLRLQASPTVLPKGASKSFTVAFAPALLGPFHARVPVNVSGLYTLHIDLKATVVRRAVAPADRSMATVAIGAVRVGKTKRCKVELLNSAPISASVDFAPAAAQLGGVGVTIEPLALQLAARGRGNVTLVFKPKQRLAPFTEAVHALVSGAQHRVLTVAGSAQGLAMQLGTQALAFGTVVMGSQTTKQVQLMNTGDVGAKFEWDGAALKPHFTIAPAQGFLAPGQDVKLQVTLDPRQEAHDICLDAVPCNVEGLPKPLTLTLTGAAVDDTNVTATLQLACAARARASQGVTVANPSAAAWHLRPVVQGPFFSGAEVLSVPAGGKAEYAVHYQPLTMSAEGAPHSGSVFFPIPDGSGLLYRLEGTAAVPAPVDTVRRQLLAKEAHTEELAVENWLPKAQRFAVSIERTAVPEATALRAPSHIDVPPLSSKPCRVGITAYAAEPLKATVRFTNETTGEFLTYDLDLTVAEAAPMAELELGASVRGCAEQRIAIPNPLAREVTLIGACTHRLVGFPAQVTLPASGSAAVAVSYRPLVAGEASAALTFKCPELGTYAYSLRLVGHKAPCTQSLAFDVALGRAEMRTVTFRHFAPSATVYSVKLSDSAAAAGFAAPPTLAAAAAPDGGADMELAVTFQPSQLGDAFRETVTVFSPEGGEYECKLVGRCVAPTPQGPMRAAGGKGAVTVPFANPFTTDAEFRYCCDNPAFSGKAGEVLKARQQAQIAFAFKEVAGKPRTAKLTVTCAALTPCQWVFYLEA